MTFFDQILSSTELPQNKRTVRHMRLEILVSDEQTASSRNTSVTCSARAKKQFGNKLVIVNSTVSKPRSGNFKIVYLIAGSYTDQNVLRMTLQSALAPIIFGPNGQALSIIKVNNMRKPQIVK